MGCKDVRSNGRERPQNSVLNKTHHLEAPGNKYKDLCEFITQSLKMMPFVLDRNFNTSKVVNLRQDTKIANFSRKIIAMNFVRGLAKQNMSPQYLCVKKPLKMANDIEGMELCT